jgi:hypothetical protein
VGRVHSYLPMLLSGMGECCKTDWLPRRGESDSLAPDATVKWHSNEPCEIKIRRFRPTSLRQHGCTGDEMGVDMACREENGVARPKRSA